MKNIKIALIAVISVIILGLCVLMGYGISRGPGWGGGNVHTGWGDSYELVQEKEIPAAGIDSICIEYKKTGNDVMVYEAEGDSIILREYANYQVSENELSQLTTQNGKVIFKDGKRRNNRFFIFSINNINQSMYTELYLPAAYSGELKINTVSGEIQISTDLDLEADLSLSSTSGDIGTDTQNIRAEKIRAASTSGEIRLSVLEAQEVDVSTTSGDIRIERADNRVTCSSTSGNITVCGGAGDRTLSSTSGDIRVDGLSGKCSVDTTSGEIQIDGESGYGSADSTSGDVQLLLAELSGDFSANTTSGEISLSLESLLGDISVDTLSGDVRLKLPKEVSLDFEASTTSGDIDTFFDDALKFSKKGNHASGTVGDGEKRQVEIHTTSGEVRVTER